MKRYITYILFLTLSLPLLAQDAMKVLDIAADRIRNAGDIEIEYKASIFSGATEKASATGTMWLREKSDET